MRVMMKRIVGTVMVVAAGAMTLAPSASAQRVPEGSAARVALPGARADLLRVRGGLLLLPGLRALPRGGE